MKSIKSIISTVMLTGVILLSNITSIPTYADTQPVNSTHEANGMYNTIVTKVTDTEVYVNINNDEYSFYCDEEGWEVNDKITITLKNDEILDAMPTVDFKTVYKLSENGTTYTKELTTDKDLEEYSNQFLKDNFNDTLNVPIIFNKIGSPDINIKTNGMTEIKPDNTGVMDILINTDLAQEYNQVKCERVLVHELLHYELYKQHKHFEDKTDDFENAIKEYGSCSNDGTEYYMNSHVLVNQELYNLSK
jgi:hypothetical protein